MTDTTHKTTNTPNGANPHGRVTCAVCGLLGLFTAGEEADALALGLNHEDLAIQQQRTDRGWETIRRIANGDTT